MQEVPLKTVESSLLKSLELLDIKVWCWGKHIPGMYIGNASCVSTEMPPIYELKLRLYIRADKKRLCVDLVHVLNQPIPEHIELDVLTRAIHRLIRKDYPGHHITRITSDVIDTKPLRRYS